MSTDALLGRLLGGTYGIEQPLGQGGFGTVYIARHARTGKRYAVKVLRADRVGVSEQIMMRFRREAETLAALGHPGIVSIHDFASTDDGIEYLVMDLLEGEDLAQRLARVGRLPLPAALGLMNQLASALGAAHGQAIMHRDLKPANIFLKQIPGEPERATILDFGLAKMMDEVTEERLTASGVAMGTPQYMSPEQASGSVIDHRTDIYALASIFYEVVCGAPPFEAPTMSALMVKILTAPPTPLSTRTPVPPHVDQAISCALAKNPEERYPSAAALVAALEGRDTSASVTRPGRAATPVPMTRELEAAQAAALATASGQTTLPDQAVGQTTAPMPGPETPHAWSVVGAQSRAPGPVAQPGRNALLAIGALAVLSLAVIIGGTAVWLATSGEDGGGDDGAPVAVMGAPSELATIPETLPSIVEEPGPADAGSVADAHAGPAAVGAAAEDAGAGGAASSVTTREPRPRGGMRGSRPGDGSGAGAGATPSAPTTPTMEAAPPPTAPPVVAYQLPPAVVAQQQAQAALFEAQVREIEAMLTRMDTLVPRLRGLSQGRKPPICDGEAVRAMSRPSDVPSVVSAQQRIRREVERICEPFERLENTPPEIRRDLDSISRTLDRAEEMTRATFSSNQPTAVADQIRAAIGDTRRALAGVEEGRRPFPCNDPVFRRLRRLKDAGNSYSGAAAGRVLTLKGRICGRLGTEVEDLRRDERRFRDALDSTEESLRGQQRTFRQAIAQLRP